MLDPNSKPKILIILFFCLRIIIIKSSARTRAEILKLIWPILLSQVISIFNNEIHVEDLNVKLAALKLLEIISIKHPECFCTNYWILGYDFYDLEIVSMKDKKLENVHTFPSPFAFVPFMTKLIKKQVEVKYNSVQNDINGNFKTDQKRRWIVTENRVDSDEELSQIAERFMLYMIEINNQIVEQPEDFDSIIIEDFKRLNEFSMK